MLPLGFASGLPLLLTGSTLTAWMASEGLDLAAIGAFALVGLPYSLKFLWAPVLDRFAPALLGRRRGWMLLTQLALVAAIAAMGLVSPRVAPGALAWVALLVAALSATQDIASDAYRADVLRPAERAAGTATFVAGYRVGMIAAGAGALVLTASLHWWGIYALLGATMLVGVGATALAPEPAPAAPPPSLRAAVVEPLRELLRRGSVAAALFVVATYKLGEALAGHMVTPFLVRTGYGLVEIGAVAKGVGLAATLVGALLGGGLTARLGQRRSLVIFGAMQAVANLVYLGLHHSAPRIELLTLAIVADNLAGGLATTAFVALLMGLCDARYTAFQFALMTSLSSLGGRLLGAPAGWIAEELGWTAFFVATIALPAPALWVISRARGSFATPRQTAEPAADPL
jgi:PAT family beta-lactamase induction signal transducer AmpG